MNMLNAFTPLRMAGLTLLCALATVPGEVRLKEADHKKVADLVDAYFTAMNDEKGILEALQKVIDQIPVYDKKLKGTKFLASIGDWEQVFRLVSEERAKVVTLKKRGEVAEAKLKADFEISLAYSLPKKAKGSLPLILIACDSGEKPAAHLDTYWNDPALREGAALVALDLGGAADSYGIFGDSSAPGGALQITTAMSLLQRELAVDCNRRYLVGSGKGFAAVEATASSYPQFFAGLIGIGDVAATDVGDLENFRALPTLFLHGGEGAKAMEAKAGEYGYGNCTLEAEGGAAKAWEWIGKNPRSAYPAHMTFAPKRDNAKFLHWITISGFQSAESPRIEAKAERESNTITIEADKIAQLVVYLNDELVDLEKPVRFSVNGTIHEQTVVRNAPDMIKNQYFGGDWGRVFTGIVSLDVPAK